jgi:hypothetical protein
LYEYQKLNEDHVLTFRNLLSNNIEIAHISDQQGSNVGYSIVILTGILKIYEHTDDTKHCQWHKNIGQYHAWILENRYVKGRILIVKIALPGFLVLIVYYRIDHVNFLFKR